MWEAVTDAVGPDARDALWDHPDVLPESSDIDDPSALIARLRALADGTPVAQDDVDLAIAELLSDSGDDRPRENTDGTANEPDA